MAEAGEGGGVGQPWASGPAEILRHGIGHLEQDSDTDRRLAMISIDNAVELIIKTFLNQPKRAPTSLKLTRKQKNDIGEGFLDQLDAIEAFAPERLDGIDLAEMEWFHTLRNELYHQGNGLTVERDKVFAYSVVAKLLFRNLFGETLDIEASPIAAEPELSRLERFMEAWFPLSHLVGGSLSVSESGVGSAWQQGVEQLDAAGQLDESTRQRLEQLHELRQALFVDPEGHDVQPSEEDISTALELEQKLRPVVERQSAERKRRNDVAFLEAARRHRDGA
jgi:hypothetical protein